MARKGSYSSFIPIIIVVLLIGVGIMWVVDLFDDKEQNEPHYVITSEDVTQKIIII